MCSVFSFIRRLSRPISIWIFLIFTAASAPFVGLRLSVFEIWSLIASSHETFITIASISSIVVITPTAILLVWISSRFLTGSVHSLKNSLFSFVEIVYLLKFNELLSSLFNVNQIGKDAMLRFIQVNKVTDLVLLDIKYRLNLLLFNRLFNLFS